MLSRAFETVKSIYKKESLCLKSVSQHALRLQCQHHRARMSTLILSLGTSHTPIGRTPGFLSWIVLSRAISGLGAPGSGIVHLKLP